MVTTSIVNLELDCLLFAIHVYVLDRLTNLQQLLSTGRYCLERKLHRLSSSATFSTISSGKDTSRHAVSLVMPLEMSRQALSSKPIWLGHQILFFSGTVLMFDSSATRRTWQIRHSWKSKEFDNLLSCWSYCNEERTDFWKKFSVRNSSSTFFRSS